MGGGIYNKINAFTLIELLAIIVILAIIAVITVPIILNVIENAKKGAAVDSAYGYKDAIEKYYLTELSKDSDFGMNGKYTIGENGELVGEVNEIGETPTHSIPLSGTVPSEGWVELENGTVKYYSIRIGDYVVSLTGENDEIQAVKNGEISLTSEERVKLNAQKKVQEYIDELNKQDCSMTTAYIKEVSELNSLTSVENSPTEGWILFDANCKVVDFSVKLDENYSDYVVSYDEVVENNYKSKVTTDGPKSQPTFKGTVLTGNDIPSSGHMGVEAIVYLDPTNLLTICNETEPITAKGCMKWYAIKELSTTDTYTMILDRNVISGSSGAASIIWNSSGTNYDGPGKADNELLTILKEKTDDWKVANERTDSYTAEWTYNGTQSYTIDYSGYRARILSAEEINKITGKGTTTASTIVDDLDTSCKNMNVCSKGTNKYAWLFDHTGNVGGFPTCENYGCNVASSGSMGYWTSSPDVNNSDKAWRVHFIDALYSTNIKGNDASGVGIRPVITVSKSKLQ